MAAKKKIELFVEINNSRDFHHELNKNKDKLICAELYCSYFGSCTALDRLFTSMKLDWSNGEIVLLKVLVDEIDKLQRFKDHSEPFYIFIVNKKITQVFRGVDCMRFAEVAKQEIKTFQEGLPSERETFELDEPTPEEIKWHKALAEEKAVEMSVKMSMIASRQATRKRHRAELMAPYLQSLNFVMYWPHAKHAHPELYERWDLNNIIMVGREELQLTEEKAKDILYAGDAEINEASMHALLSGSALAICFRLLDGDRHFVSLVRRILYEDVPQPDESKPLNEQEPQKTAFNLYKSYSPTREQVLRKRKEDRQKRKEELLVKRARRLSEMQRLARQAVEDKLQARRLEKEQKKLELLRTGDLEALDKLREEPDDEETSIIIPEDLPEGIEEISSSEEEDENEYFPPSGLLIPAFYSPPNDVAKANGLAILFPKLVLEKVTPEPEFLPPHVLVMLQISKRHKAIEALAKYKSAVINMGIFKGSSPYNSKHIAYSVRQYDSMDSQIPIDPAQLRLAFMLSVQSDVPLLQLMDLYPEHVSRDCVVGVEECAAMFPVTYGDGYPQLEDFPSD